MKMYAISNSDQFSGFMPNQTMKFITIAFPSEMTDDMIDCFFFFFAYPTSQPLTRNIFPICSPS
jgi:hypothetical protein